MSQLPDQDLARVTNLPEQSQIVELKRIKGGWGLFNYHPVKRFAPDILNIDLMKIGYNPATDWSITEREITRAASRQANKEIAIDANLGIARALRDLAARHDISGWREDFPGWNVTYWYPAIILIDGRPTAFYIDPRRGMKLWGPGRQFVFSVMHERIRRLDHDFADIDLAIMQFDVLDDGSRAAKLHTVGETELLKYDTLLSMISRTKALWHDVLNERESQRRRRGRGGGPFSLS